jgi:hypothetical protein
MSLDIVLFIAGALMGFGLGLTYGISAIGLDKHWKERLWEDLAAYIHQEIRQVREAFPDYGNSAISPKAVTLEEPASGPGGEKTR